MSIRFIRACRRIRRSPEITSVESPCTEIRCRFSSAKTSTWDALEIIDPELEPLAVGRKTEPQDANLICQKAREDGKMVVVYGIVKYRDVFAPDRTTTFGYRVRVDGVLTRLTGYPEYNRNT